MPTDREEDGLGGAGQPNPTDNPSKTINWERKYKGQSSLFEKTRLENERLKQESFDIAQAHELELSTARLEAQKAAKEALDAKNAAEAFQLAKEGLEKEVTKYRSRQTTAERIAKDFTPLLELYNSGDLREPSEFENDEKYVEYLNRMNKLASGSKSSVSAVGSVPAISTRTNDTTVTRSEDEISKEMWNLDTRNPDDNKKFNLLVEELSAAQAKHKNT